MKTPHFLKLYDHTTTVTPFSHEQSLYAPPCLLFRNTWFQLEQTPSSHGEYVCSHRPVSRMTCSALSIPLGHTFPCTLAQLAPENFNTFSTASVRETGLFYFLTFPYLDGCCRQVDTLFMGTPSCVLLGWTEESLCLISVAKVLRPLALTVWTWVTCLNNFRPTFHPPNKGSKNSLRVID